MQPLDWQSLQSTNQEYAHFFVYSTFEIALLCAHLVNQNLMPPYRKTGVHPKYSFQACLLVLVMLRVMEN
jgi:hypothetical protein